MKELCLRLAIQEESPDSNEFLLVWHDLKFPTLKPQDSERQIFEIWGEEVQIFWSIEQFPKDLKDFPSGIYQFPSIIKTFEGQTKVYPGTTKADKFMVHEFENWVVGFPKSSWWPF